jgi:hypothetical protein
MPYFANSVTRFAAPAQPVRPGAMVPLTQTPSAPPGLSLVTGQMLSRADANSSGRPRVHQQLVKPQKPPPSPRHRGYCRAAGHPQLSQRPVTDGVNRGRQPGMAPSPVNGRSSVFGIPMHGLQPGAASLQ